MGHYRKLLVTTDFSDRAREGVAEGAALARDLGASVVLAYAVQDRLPPMMLGSGLHWDEILEGHRERAREALEELAGELLAGVETSTVVRVGEPAGTLLDIAEEEDVDLIVMASHGYGFVGQIVLGSTTERVLKRCCCPVLVVRCVE